MCGVNMVRFKGLISRARMHQFKPLGTSKHMAVYCSSQATAVFVVRVRPDSYAHIVFESFMFHSAHLLRVSSDTLMNIYIYIYHIHINWIHFMFHMYQDFLVWIGTKQNPVHCTEHQFDYMECNCFVMSAGRLVG